MAEIITCPECKGALLEPSDVEATSELECPLCMARFELSKASPATLPAARRIPTNPEPAPVVPKSQVEPPAVAEPAPAKPAAAGSLSEWLNKAEETTIEFEAPPRSPDLYELPAQPVVGAVTDEQPDSEKRPDADVQPSLESLLSSFRGEQPLGLDKQPTEEPLAESETIAKKVAAEESDATPVPEPRAEKREEKLTVSSFATLAEVAPVRESPEESAGEPKGEDGSSYVAPPNFEFELPEQPHENSVVAKQPVIQAGGVPIASGKLGKPQRQHSSNPWVLKSAMVAASGLLGVGLGYLGLLWIAGPKSDLLGASRWLPSAALPTSFAMASEPVAEPAPLTPESNAGTSRGKIEQMTYESQLAGSSSHDSLTDEDVPNEPPLMPGFNARQMPPAEVVVPSDAPGPFPFARLRQLLPGAEEARRAMSQNSLAENPAAARELGAAFAQLCLLAEALTFSVESPTDDGLTLLEAKEVFQRLFQYDHARDDARGMAVRWVHWGQRSHGGVFFAGELVSGQQRGSVYEYLVDIGDQAPVAVLSNDPIRVNRFLKAKSMGVVGCLIDSPETSVPGYTGQATQAVWAGHTISLGEAKFN